jgi:hypothetical protein
MARPCSVCHHASLPKIAADMVNGVSDVVIAQRYGLARSSVQRHRQHSGAPTSTVAAERKANAFVALAALPTREEAGAALSSIGTRIDEIAEQAKEEGSLAIALMGLRELKGVVVSQATSAGHIGSGTQVAVQVNNNIDMGSAVSELIAALKPRADRSIPKQLRAHIEAGPPDLKTLERLEAAVDADD